MNLNNATTLRDLASSDRSEIESNHMKDLAAYALKAFQVADEATIIGFEASGAVSNFIEAAMSQTGDDIDALELRMLVDKEVCLTIVDVASVEPASSADGGRMHSVVQMGGLIATMKNGPTSAEHRYGMFDILMNNVVDNVGDLAKEIENKYITVSLMGPHGPKIFGAGTPTVVLIGSDGLLVVGMKFQVLNVPVMRSLA